MFIFFLLLPFWISNTVNAFLCIFIFFYFYERTVALPRSHLWFIFMSACLLGSFAYLFYYITDILLYPHSTVLPYSPLTVLMIEQLFEWILVVLLAYPAKRYLGWLLLFMKKKYGRSYGFHLPFLCFFLNILFRKTAIKYTLIKL